MNKLRFALLCLSAAYGAIASSPSILDRHKLITRNGLHVKRTPSSTVGLDLAQYSQVWSDPSMASWTTLSDEEFDSAVVNPNAADLEHGSTVASFMSTAGFITSSSPTATTFAATPVPTNASAGWQTGGFLPMSSTPIYTVSTSTMPQPAYSSSVPTGTATATLYASIADTTLRQGQSGNKAYDDTIIFEAAPDGPMLGNPPNAPMPTGQDVGTPWLYVVQESSPSPKPTPTPSVYCHYDSVKHFGGGKYVNQEGVSCETAQPSSSTKSSTSSSTTSNASTSSTRMPGIFTEEAVKAVLGSLSHVTVLPTSWVTKTEVATHTSAAGAARLRPMFF